MKGAAVKKHASIHDVAIAAGVSPATVSNVLNRPNNVAASTRTRVLGAIESLKFQRNEQAASLRLGKTSTSRRRATDKPVAGTACTPRPAPAVPAPAAPVPQNVPDGPGWQDIPVAQPVLIGRFGQQLGTGLTEGSMPDGSCIWVRFDDGRGRQLLTKDDGYSVSPMPAVAEP